MLQSSINDIIQLRQQILINILQSIQMKEVESDFRQIIRTYVLRAVQITKEKSTPAQAEEIEHSFLRMIGTDEPEEATIARIINLDLKSDYHQNLLLLLLQQLAKWSFEHYITLKERISPIQTLITCSISLLEAQEQLQAIVPRQNQLIASLLVIPTCIENLENFRPLYRRLKDVKQYYPSTIKQSQKVLFIKTVEECIIVCAKYRILGTIQFIHGNMIRQIEQIINESDHLPSRLRIIRKIIKGLWQQNQQIALSSAYLVMKLSNNIISKPSIFGHILNLYETLMDYFLKSDCLVPMILFEHVIMNNLKDAQKRKQVLLIQLLLQQMCNIFETSRISYFLKLYDWNFMAEGLCQKTIQLVFNFTQNRENQKKPQFQLYKKCLRNIIVSVQHFIDSLPTNNSEKQTFYEAKKQQYQLFVQQINSSPKKVFKRVDQMSQVQKEHIIKKYVHILRRSPHIQKKSMIGILSSQHSASKQILQKYLQSLMGMCKEYDLEQFLRFFISNFFLTGQAQQIERMLDELTKFFFRHQSQQSQSLFKNSDSAYCFANAIIILNTDLHNPKNQNKMSEEAFIKMCKNINDGQDLPLQVIKKTYINIKKYQIHNFRDLYNLNGISYSNWLLITADPALSQITYYDQQIGLVNETGFEYFAKEILSAIVNEKEDAKLESMVERFEYDDKNFQCDIIEDIRKSINKRSHLALHVLQKIYEKANFRNSRFSDKIMSYYWLAVRIIQTFSSKIPAAKCAQLLILTVKLRIQLNDHLYTRQKTQFRKIKHSIKEAQKRQSKKSIMDIFTNFLSKDYSSEDQIPPPLRYTKKMNYQNFGISIFQILQQNIQQNNGIIEFLVHYICNGQAKIFEEFMSLLSLIYHLSYTISSLNEEVIQFFQQILNLRQSQLTNRLNILKQKDGKKFALLDYFSKYWILRIFLKNIQLYDKYPQLVCTSMTFVDIADKNMLLGLINDIKKASSLPQQLINSFFLNITRLQIEKDQISWFIDKYGKKLGEEEINQNPNQQIVDLNEDQNFQLLSEQKKIELNNLKSEVNKENNGQIQNVKEQISKKQEEESEKKDQQKKIKEQQVDQEERVRLQGQQKQQITLPLYML